MMDVFYLLILYKLFLLINYLFFLTTKIVNDIICMKISFIGAGGVGCTTAFLCGIKGFFDEIVLVDLYKDYAEGKAIDLQQGFILNNIKNINVYGTDDYSYIKSSDVIVITAGVPSHGQQTREELLEKNKLVIGDCAKKVSKLVPTDHKQPLIIMVTNPLDVILKHFIEVGNFNKQKTIGSGNWLDTARFKYYLAERLNVKPEKIETYVVGQHGAKMVYLLSQTKINGIALFEYIKRKNISMDEIKEIEDKATNGATTIIKKIEKGGTFYGPAVSIGALISAYVNNTKKVYTASVWANGEYNIKDLCFGCPIIIGKHGVEKILNFQLSDEENRNMKSACNFIESLTK